MNIFRKRDTLINYEVVRSKRKSVSIEVKAHGKVLVRAPRLLSDKKINEFVEEKSDWIEAHVERVLKREKELDSVEKLSEKELKELTKEAKKRLTKKVEYFSDIIGVDYGKITIRKQRTRWGSCSSKGNLNFNCLLVKTPEYVQDYVVVHELCHRIHMNHSKAFWGEVEGVLPEYRVAKDWLSGNGAAVMAQIEDAPVKDSKYFAYILRCADNSLYVGYTPNLEHRLKAHNSGTGAKYTRTRLPVELVYYEEFETKEEAFRREALLKQLTHKEKERLIKNKALG